MQQHIAPVRNAISTTWTPIGTSSDRDGEQAIAVAAKRPVHKPMRQVSRGIVESSYFFSARLEGVQSQ